MPRAHTPAGEAMRCKTTTAAASAVAMVRGPCSTAHASALQHPPAASSTFTTSGLFASTAIINAVVPNCEGRSGEGWVSGQLMHGSMAGWCVGDCTRTTTIRPYFDQADLARLTLLLVSIFAPCSHRSRTVSALQYWTAHCKSRGAEAMMRTLVSDVAVTVAWARCCDLRDSSRQWRPPAPAVARALGATRHLSKVPSTPPIEVTRGPRIDQTM